MDFTTYSITHTPNFTKLPYQLDIQYFGGEGGEGAQSGGQEQITFEPKFGMTEFNEFLNSDQNAQALFNAKLNQALLEKQAELEPTLLEKAKAALAQEAEKPAWQIEIDKLKAENAAKEKALAQEATRSHLTSRFSAAAIEGVTPEQIHAFCLRDTVEESNKAYDNFMALVDAAAEAKTAKELENRSRGFAFQPVGGSRGGASSNEPQGVLIARQIAETRTNHNSHSKGAKDYFFSR